MRFHEFPAGAVICREGDPGSSMFVLVEGLAYALVALPEEPELRTRSVFAEGRLASKLRRGDVIGVMSLITGEPQLATVKAAVPSAALELREDDFRTLIAKSRRVLANLTRILSGELAVTTRRHAQRGTRGEAVALIAGPSLAAAIPDILAATAAASAKPVRSLDARESVEDALEELDEALLEHGTVVARDARSARRALGLVAEHVDRAVVVLAEGEGEMPARPGGDGACWSSWRWSAAGPPARRPSAGRRSSDTSPMTATRWPASRRTRWRGSAGTWRGPRSAWRSAPAAPRGTRTSGRSRCSRRPDTSSTAWGARASARSWAPTWRSG